MATSDQILEMTDDNWGEAVDGSPGLTIVDFWAEWCGPCRIVAPIVEQLAEDYGEKGLRVGKMDVDTNPQTSMRFGIRSIPSILFFKNGELVDRVIGAVPRPHLEEKVIQHL